MRVPNTLNVKQIEVLKSTFIAILIPINDKNLIKDEIAKIKKEYPKAKHYVYACKINEFSKCSDDGEPSGTAGRPLLELLNKKELDQSLLVVVRYFGGTLLGASRLLRTYVESAILCIDNATYVTPTNFYQYSFCTDYRTFDLLKSNMNKLGFNIEKVEYNDTIKLSIISKNNILNELYSYGIKDIDTNEVVKLI